MRRPDLAKEIGLRYRKAKAGWEKTRLLCAKLASEGQHQAEEIAGLSGCSVKRIFDWLRMTREGGLDALLKRGKPGPKAGELRLLKDKPQVKKQIKKGLGEGRWSSAPQLSRWWLKAEHGMEVKDNTAWTWLKNSEGCCGFPARGIPEEMMWRCSSSRRPSRSGWRRWHCRTAHG